MLPLSPYIIDCRIDNMTLNINAVQNESTENPPTSSLQIKIMIALITNRKRPKVNTVTGKVKITMIGLINKFNNARTIATIKEVVKFCTCTPSI